MSAPILEVSELKAGYGKKLAVHGVDLTLAEREVLLILGHNGAGKTTLMRSVFGLLPPQGGAVRYRGGDITSRGPAANVLDGIAFVPQGHGVFPTLSVRDNLDLGSFVVEDKRKIQRQLEIVYDLFPILRERSRQLAGTLSGGQQQMLAIGMALMHEPSVLLLDEPSIGLAPALVDTVMKSIREINRHFGTAILMVEQNVSHSLGMADRCIIIKTGGKVYDGPPSPLADHVELMKYF